MSDLHHIKIWLDKNGISSRLEIDGREVQGITEIGVQLVLDEPAHVIVDLVPRLLEIEGEGTIELHREILPIAAATAERR